MRASPTQASYRDAVPKDQVDENRIALDKNWTGGAMAHDRSKIALRWGPGSSDLPALGWGADDIRKVGGAGLNESTSPLSRKIGAPFGPKPGLSVARRISFAADVRPNPLAARQRSGDHPPMA